MYIYWQQSFGSDAWNPVLARDKEHVIAQRQPQLTTVLSVNRVVADVPPDELLQLKYLGPFYADFDAPEAETAIKQVNSYLDKLEALGVDLHSVGLFATGNRGFHVEVSIETFLPKPPKDGIVQLPAIYKEMAYDLYVDALDLRVYTGRSGRMWRVTNIKRDNGAYKVPITPEEARSMTPELYTQLCATPRPYGTAVPNLSAPKFSPELATKFARAEQQIQDHLKRRKSSKADKKLLEKFGKKVPPTLEALLAGVGIAETAGWNELAMQIAISMNALGKQEEEIVEMAKRLIDTHRGNGNRYNTPRKREAELRLQIAYTANNPCYVFSVGAIKKLLEPGSVAPDLEGIDDEAQAQAFTEAVQGVQEEGGGKPLHVGNIVVTSSGIYQKTEEGQKAISAVGFEEVRMFVGATDDAPGGFEVVLTYRGRRKRVALPFDALQSRSKLNGFLSSKVGGTFSGSDVQAGFVQEWLMVMSQRNNAAAGSSDDLLLRREGLDVIQLPETMEVPAVAREPFPVFASPQGCVAPPAIDEAGLKFRFLGDPTPSGQHKSDIARAPELVADERTYATLRALFDMNRERVIAACLGWHMAAHARMFYHRHRGQFPLLAISGQAGAGKTETTRVLMRLHFHKQEPTPIQCSLATIYGITSAIQASASIPVWLDEYKPRDIGAAKTGALRAIFRACYNNGAFVKGGAGQAVMANGREIMQAACSGPTMFLGEATEMESAILERSVVVLFDKTGAHGKSDRLRFVQDNADVLSAVGRQMLLSLLALPFEKFAESFDKDHEIAKQALLDRDNYRLVYNYAVARHGLTLLDAVLRTAGVDLTTEIDELKASLLLRPGATGTGTTRVRAEASKVLSSFAQMTRTIEHDAPMLTENNHYAFSDAGGVEVIEICLPLAFAKYEMWQRARGRQPLYDSEEQFLVAMRNYSAFVDDTPQVLTDLPHVMRFNLNTLNVEGVEDFRRRA